MTILTRTFLLSMLASSGTSEAKILQILHTNDLHASLNVAGAAADQNQTYGGWAQLKTVMDQLTEKAKAQQIETIRLDAGDFFEGTLSYFPDHGINVLKAFQSLGYDAGALGNHDWMMGAQNSDEVFGLSPFPFPLLSANSQFSPNLVNLNKQIIPSTQILREGMRIGIVGLSTDELFYQWITNVDSYSNDMNLLNYRDYWDSQMNEMVSGIANEEAARLHEKNDLVIALTHIGFNEDQKLAASSSNIDLIVGGHSHTRLDSLALVENAKGQMIPIVQTGVTGISIGKILVDVVPGKKPEVLSYELVPVPHTAPADPVIAKLLQRSEKRIEDLYGAKKLNQVIGHSDARLISGNGGPTAYSKFIVDAMRDTAGTDLAFDFGEFHSNSAQEKGDVTMRKLMEMYPRKLNVEQNEGLYLYRFKIQGWILKLVLELATQFGFPISISGIEYQTYGIEEPQLQSEKDKLGTSWKAKALGRKRLAASSILINGSPLKLLKHYSVATPEFIVRGAYAVSPLTRLIIRRGKSTAYTLWDASELYLTKIKTIKEEPNIKNNSSPVNQTPEYPYGSELAEEILHQISTQW